MKNGVSAAEKEHRRGMNSRLCSFDFGAANLGRLLFLNGKGNRFSRTGSDALCGLT